MRAALSIVALLLATALHAADAPKPLRVLLITGGVGHDHAAQKDILKKGIESRANVVVEQLHTEGNLSDPPLPILGNPDYAKGFDVVIHDPMTPGIYRAPTVRAVLKPHLVDGIPAVVLHVGASAYRSGQNDRTTAPREAGFMTWTEFTGVIVHGHGGSAPIAISFADKTHPATRGLADWTTMTEELYHQVEVFPSARVLAKGTLQLKDKPEEAVVAWCNELKLANGKTVRAFSTSLGHRNETVADPRYLDLVTNGLLWAADKLDENGKPREGYAK